jgi:threonylcarbamoyladenosine tRNA methylthiotransferase MtaB
VVLAVEIKGKCFNIITLGCRVNLCESNSIVEQIKAAGGKYTTDINKAQIIIINTCSVTARADSKSRNMINRASQAKMVELVVCMGCYSQLHSAEITNENVCVIIGNKYKNKIVDLIGEYESKKIVKITNIRQENKIEDNFTNSCTEKTRAFIKIQDGCDFMCTYCLIPFVRGKQRSLSPISVINTIKDLIKNNYKEIVLTGVNTSGYKYGTCTFYNLLLKISQLPGTFRIRISSVEPFQMNKKIIDLMLNKKERFCQFLHLCLQSGCDKTLADMGRKYTIIEFTKIVTDIRSINPLFSISTDLIVGYATESQAEFAVSAENVKNIQFCDIHIFPYSPRKNTAAFSLKNSVSPSQLKNRFNIIHEINQTNQANYLKKFIGEIVNVLFEKSSIKNYQSGHSEYFFKVLVKTNKSLQGNMYRVEITKIVDNTVYGILI